MSEMQFGTIAELTPGDDMGVEVLVRNGEHKLPICTYAGVKKANKIFVVPRGGESVKQTYENRYEEKKEIEGNWSEHVQSAPPPTKNIVKAEPRKFNFTRPNGESVDGNVAKENAVSNVASPVAGSLVKEVDVTLAKENLDGAETGANTGANITSDTGANTGANTGSGVNFPSDALLSASQPHSTPHLSTRVGNGMQAIGREAGSKLKGIADVAGSKLKGIAHVATNVMNRGLSSKAKVISGLEGGKSRTKRRRKSRKKYYVK